MDTTLAVADALFQRRDAPPRGKQLQAHGARYLMHDAGATTAVEAGP
jgi:hypothetical protein